MNTINFCFLKRCIVKVVIFFIIIGSSLYAMDSGKAGRVVDAVRRREVRRVQGPPARVMRCDKDKSEHKKRSLDQCSEHLGEAACLLCAGICCCEYPVTACCTVVPVISFALLLYSTAPLREMGDA